MYQNDNNYSSATSLDLENHILTHKQVSVNPSQILEGGWPSGLDPNACEFIPYGSSLQTEGNPGNNPGILNPHARGFIPPNNISQIFTETSLSQ